MDTNIDLTLSAKSVGLVDNVIIEDVFGEYWLTMDFLGKDGNIVKKIVKYPHGVKSVMIFNTHIRVWVKLANKGAYRKFPLLVVK